MYSRSEFSPGECDTIIRTHYNTVSMSNPHQVRVMTVLRVCLVIVSIIITNPVEGCNLTLDCSADFPGGWMQVFVVVPTNVGTVYRTTNCGGVNTCWSIVGPYTNVGNAVAYDQVSFVN